MDYKKIFLKEATPTSIGGQAIMEGVMMRGEHRTALAVRVPDGRIYLKTERLIKKNKINKIPFVRGVYNFFVSLIAGMRTLMQSADVLEHFLPEEDVQKPNKVEAAVGKKYGERAMWNFMMAAAVTFSLVISIVCFIIFPTVVVNFLGKWIKSGVVLNLIEGIFRILLFVLYVALIRRMDDIKTLFRYHGAEHKTIHCYENGLELTPENARQFCTLHPRCGTSFLMFVFIISLLLFSLLGWPNVWMRILSRVLLLPVIAGISYELLKWAGRSDGIAVRILSYPGLMMQQLTTAEPTDAQLEVAIVSLKAVLVDKHAPIVEGFVDKDAKLLEKWSLKDAEEEAVVNAAKDTAELDIPAASGSGKAVSGAAGAEPAKGNALDSVTFQDPVPVTNDTVIFNPATIIKPLPKEDMGMTVDKIVAEAGEEERWLEDFPIQEEETITEDGDAAVEPADTDAEAVEEPVADVVAEADTVSDDADATADVAEEAPADEPEEAPTPAPADATPAAKARMRYTQDTAMVRNAVRHGQELLKDKPNGDSAAVDLFCYVMGWTRSEIVTRGRELLDSADLRAYMDRIDLRLSGVPMQYIVKVQEFMGLPFRVNPDVLIPRLDTEILAEQVIGIIRGKGWTDAAVLDLCTGSGALGITIAHEFPGAAVTLTDVSPAAIETARRNAEINGTTANCRFLVGNMFNALPEDALFDVIVSNPPYIPTAVIETLDTEVKDHEPVLALDGGEDGLDAYRVISMEAGQHLRSGGVLALEIGYDQAEAVSLLLEITKQFRQPAVIKDLNGLNRVLIAERI